MPKIGDLRIHWYPQIPCVPFKIDIDDIAQGKSIMKILAKYDEFQFKNNIKPDYCNTGCILEYSDYGEGPDWFEIDEDNL